MGKNKIVDNFGQEFEYENKSFAKGGYGELYQAKKLNQNNYAYVFKKLIQLNNNKDPFLFNYEIVKFEKLLSFKKDIEEIKELCFPQSFVMKPAGYIMRRIKRNYREVTELINNGKALKRIETSYKIMKILSSLHEKGYYLGDVNPRNFMYDPENNNDPIVIDFDTIEKGETKSTIRFRGYGDPLNVLSIKSDTFRAAKIIFQILSGKHPFIDGEQAKKEEDYDEACDKADRGEYPYILHPSDKTNVLKFGKERNINIPDCFSENLKKLFEKMFVDGLKNTNSRPDSLEFAKVLHTDILCLNICFKCGFYVHSEINKGRRTCPRCKNNFKIPAIIRIKSETGEFLIPLKKDEDIAIPLHLLTNEKLNVNELFKDIFTLKSYDSTKIILKPDLYNDNKSNIVFEGKELNKSLFISNGETKELFINNKKVEIKKYEF